MNRGKIVHGPHVPINPAMSSCSADSGTARLDTGDPNEKTFLLLSPAGGSIEAACFKAGVSANENARIHCAPVRHKANRVGVPVPTVARWLGHQEGGAFTL